MLSRSDRALAARDQRSGSNCKERSLIAGVTEKTKHNSWFTWCHQGPISHSLSTASWALLQIQPPDGHRTPTTDLPLLTLQEDSTCASPRSPGKVALCLIACWQHSSSLKQPCGLMVVMLSGQSQRAPGHALSISPGRPRNLRAGTSSLKPASASEQRCSPEPRLGRSISLSVNMNYTLRNVPRSQREVLTPQMKMDVLGQWGSSLKYAPPWASQSHEHVGFRLINSNNPKPKHCWKSRQEGRSTRKLRSRFKEGPESHFSPQRVCDCSKWQTEVSARFFLSMGDSLI